MSIQIVKSFIAAAAITEFAAVKIDGAGKVLVATSPTSADTVGVAQRAVATGEAVDVVVFGETKMISNAVLTFVTTPRLSVAAGGAVAASVATNYPVARVIPNINQVSSVAGEQITVLFHGPVSIF